MIQIKPKPKNNSDDCSTSEARPPLQPIDLLRSTRSRSHQAVPVGEQLESCGPRTKNGESNHQESRRHCAKSVFVAQSQVAIIADRRDSWRASSGCRSVAPVPAIGTGTTTLPLVLLLPLLPEQLIKVSHALPLTHLTQRGFVAEVLQFRIVRLQIFILVSLRFF